MQTDSSNPEMARLLNEAAAGSEDAARQLTERYAPFLRLAVRRYLHKRLRTQFDSLDFMQDVWASLFSADGNREAFSSPKQFVTFLRSMARHKVIDALRQRLRTKKADLNRETSLQQMQARVDRLMDAQPTPSQVASSDEEWQAFLARQSPTDREVLTRYVNGKDVPTICRELDVSERTVRRALRALRAQLQPAG